MDTSSGKGEKEKNSQSASHQQSQQQSKADGNQINLGGNIEIHQPEVFFCDMKYAMKQFAFEQADLAIKLMYKQEKRYFKDAAEMIKIAFDEQFQQSWHVIVGKSFGSYFSFEAQTAIQFSINGIMFCIFKFG